MQAFKQLEKHGYIGYFIVYEIKINRKQLFYHLMP